MILNNVTEFGVYWIVSDMGILLEYGQADLIIVNVTFGWEFKISRINPMDGDPPACNQISPIIRNLTMSQIL